MNEELKSKQDVIEFVQKYIRTKGPNTPVIPKIPEQYRNDKDVILEAIKSSAESPRNIPIHLLNDSEVSKELVKRSGKLICELPKQIQQNKEIVLEVVSKNGDSLEFVLPEFKDDLEVVLAAIKDKPFSIIHASKHIGDWLNGSENPISLLEYEIACQRQEKLKEELA